MKKILKIVLSFVVLISSFTSCEKDDAKDPLFEYYQTENYAPYVRVIMDTQLIDITQIESSSVTFTVSAPGDNVASWAVSVKLDGSTTTDYFELKTVTSFPETFTYSVNELASTVGLDVADIAAGDKFLFSGVSVGGDGTVLTVNDLGPDLFGQPEQRNAYAFQVAISCPPLVFPLNGADYVGTGTITVDDWADFNIGDPIEVEAGANPNEVWVRQYDNPYINNPGTAYLIITIDTATGNVTVQSNENYDYGSFKSEVVGTGFVDGCGAIHFTQTFNTDAYGPLPGYNFAIEL
jgi:hypothetical protein